MALENKKVQILFADFMIKWLDMIKHRVEESTYTGYKRQIEGRTKEYFTKHPIMIADLKPVHILDFIIGYLIAFYGLRRSEVLDIRWSAIDFENKTITISHKVVTVTNEDKEVKTKTKMIRFHDLRHCCATLLVKKGLPDYLIKIK